MGFLGMCISLNKKTSRREKENKTLINKDRGESQRQGNARHADLKKGSINLGKESTTRVNLVILKWSVE